MGVKVESQRSAPRLTVQGGAREKSRVGRSVVRALAALAGYAVLVAVLTWPLARQLGSVLPDTALGTHWDPLLTTWVLAHETRALTTPSTPLLDTGIYVPAHDTLFYGLTAFGSLPYFAPVHLLTGNPTLAMNLALFGSIVLTAWTMHLVVRRWTGSTGGAVVAGCTFLLTRWVLWDWLPLAPSYAVLQYFPIIVYLGAAPLTGRATLLLLPLLVLQCLTDPVYLAPAVLGPLGVLAVARLARPRTRVSGGRLLAVLAATALVLVPIYVQYQAVRAANPHLDRQSLWSPSAQLPPALAGLVHDGLFAPPITLWSWYSSPLCAMAVPLVAILVALTGGAAASIGGRRGAPASLWRHGVLWTVVGGLMALPPAIVLPGGSTVFLPHLMMPILGAPLYVTLRQPIRLAVAGLMGLSMLVGGGAAEWIRRVSGGGESGGRRGAGAAVTGLLVAAMYLEYRGALGVPSAARPRLPAIYPVARAIDGTSPLIDVLRRGSGPVLELPLGPLGTDAEPNARAMYRAIFHGRPLVNGYGSYWPAGFEERMALAKRLPSAPVLAELHAATGLTAVLVHTEPGRPDRDAWRALAERGGGEGLRLEARDHDDLLFALDDRMPH